MGAFCHRVGEYRGGSLHNGVQFLPRPVALFGRCPLVKLVFSEGHDGGGGSREDSDEDADEDEEVGELKPRPVARSLSFIANMSTEETIDDDDTFPKAKDVLEIGATLTDEHLARKAGAMQCYGLQGLLKGETSEVAAVIRPAYYRYETDKVDKLVRKMRSVSKTSKADDEPPALDEFTTKELQKIYLTPKRHALRSCVREQLKTPDSEDTFKKHLSGEYSDITGRCWTEARTFKGDLWGENGPEANDVLQGTIGDCWAVCGMSMVAHYHPEAIKNAISDNEDGTYDVKLFAGKYGSVAKTFRVSNKFWAFTRKNPKGESGTPVYARGKDGVLWPMLLEKAMVFLKTDELGGEATYQNIADDDAMEPTFAVKMICGGSFYMRLVTLLGKNVITKDVEECFGNIFDAVKAKPQRMVCVSTAKTRKIGKDNFMANLYGNHSYLVIDAGYENEAEESHPYLLLRNPHGARGWYGFDFSVPEYKDKLDTELAKNGRFKIALSDVKKFFSAYSYEEEKK